MASEAEERMLALQADLARKTRLARSLEKVQDDLKREGKRFHEFKAMMEQEKADVDELEGWTLARVISSLAGKRDQALELEQEEYLAARLRVEDSENLLQQLVGEEEELEAHLSGLGKVRSKIHVADEEDRRLPRGPESRP